MKLFATSLAIANAKVWHGESDVATYEFIGGHRLWHGTTRAMFDNVYDNRHMYHSTTCTEERGIVINFKETVNYDDLHIYTRSYCCQDRYMGVCLYADGEKIACTPNDMNYVPDHLIKFSDHSLTKKEVSAKQYKLMWDHPDSSCAQIEELFFHYDGEDGELDTVRQRCELVTKLGSNEHAASWSSLSFSFMKDKKVVGTAKVSRYGNWDHVGQSASHDFGVQKLWDTVEIEQTDGTDGIQFESFQIKCDNNMQLQLVNKKECDTLWFDLKDDQGLGVGGPCYAINASQTKTAKLKLVETKPEKPDYIQTDLIVTDVRCESDCTDDDYESDGSCSSACGEGGYCCRDVSGKKNKCSPKMTRQYKFPKTNRHYCLKQPECLDEPAALKKLDKYIYRFEKLMNEWLANSSGFKTRMLEKLRDREEKMVDDFKKTNEDPVCGEDELDTQRFDQSDPCGAGKRLLRGLTDWSLEHNSKNFQNRNNAKLEGILKKIQKKIEKTNNNIKCE